MVSGRSAIAGQSAWGVSMARRGRRLKREVEIAAGFLLHFVLGGVLVAVVLTLTTRDLGLLVAVVALMIIFFFELVFNHNVRVGRIPEERARLLRILMLPMVYLAAVGLSFPFLDAPGVDPTVRLAVILTFPLVTFSVLGWSFVIIRRMRGGQRERNLPGRARIR